MFRQAGNFEKGKVNRYMTKEQIVQTLLDTKVVAVIRVDNADELVDTAIALNKGGVKALEITVHLLVPLMPLRKLARDWAAKPSSVSAFWI